MQPPSTPDATPFVTLDNARTPPPIDPENLPTFQTPQHGAKRGKVHVTEQLWIVLSTDKLHALVDGIQCRNSACSACQQRRLGSCVLAYIHDTTRVESVLRLECLNCHVAFNWSTGSHTYVNLGGPKYTHVRLDNVIAVLSAVFAGIGYSKAERLPAQVTDPDLFTLIERAIVAPAVHASAFDDRVRALAHVCLETPAMLEQVVDSHRHNPGNASICRLLLVVLDLVTELGLPLATLPAAETIDFSQVHRTARLDLAITYARKHEIELAATW